MNPRAAQSGQNHDRRINEALRWLGAATPRPGLEDRITTRLAHEQLKTQAAGAGRTHLFGIPRFAVGAAAGALACVAIVAGTVSHSHRIQPALPGIGGPPASSGIGAAGAERPAERPVTPSPTGRPRSVRRLPEGRAVISPESQKPAGVAVPKKPAPAQ